MDLCAIPLTAEKSLDLPRQGFHMKKGRKGLQALVGSSFMGACKASPRIRGKGSAFGSSDFSEHLVASSLSRLDMCTSAPQTPRSAISQDTSEKAPVQSLL